MKCESPVHRDVVRCAVGGLTEGVSVFVHVLGPSGSPGLLGSRDRSHGAPETRHAGDTLGDDERGAALCGAVQNDLCRLLLRSLETGGLPLNGRVDR